MDRKGEDFRALQEYVTAKSTLLERLASMEEKRDKIKKVIFDKIKSDYEGQLRHVIDDFRPIRIRIIQKLSDFEQEMAQVEKKLVFAKDKVIELRFRHQLGEYSEDEFRKMEYESLAQVDHIQAIWDELSVDLEDYRALIGDDKDFQRRYAFQESAQPVAEAEEYEEEFAVEPPAKAVVVVQEPVPLPAAQPIAPPVPIEEDPEIPEYEEYAEEEEPGAETPQDAAMMDDEELYGRYYRESEPDTGEIEVTAASAFFEDDMDDTGAMPGGTTDLDESSTGMWGPSGLQPVAPPPVITPPPAVPVHSTPSGKFGVASKAAVQPAAAAAPSFTWGGGDDDKESTMVWGSKSGASGKSSGSSKTEVAPPPPPPPPPPAPKTLIFKDRKNGREIAFPLGRVEVSIGRSDQNDIVLTEGKISRRHAKVHFAEGGYFLSDLNSSNGTFVNGKRISRPVVLKENDEILIGDCTMIYR